MHLPFTIVRGSVSIELVVELEELFGDVEIVSAVMDGAVVDFRPLRAEMVALREAFASAGSRRLAA